MMDRFASRNNSGELCFEFDYFILISKKKTTRNYEEKNYLLLRRTFNFIRGVHSRGEQRHSEGKDSIISIKLHVRGGERQCKDRKCGGALGRKAAYKIAHYSMARLGVKVNANRQCAPHMVTKPRTVKQLEIRQMPRILSWGICPRRMDGSL